MKAAPPTLSRKARDAMAVLAHVYLRFDRPREAAALFASLALLDEEPSWARRALCLARFRAGQLEEALELAESLLREPLDDEARLPVLHVAAKACWRLGRLEEARRHRAAASATTAVSLRQPRVRAGVP